MLQGTRFLGPLRGRWSSRSSPREPKPSFRTSPVRLVANVAVAGLVLANMILAYRLLSEDRSPIAVVLGGAGQIGEGSTALGRLRAALDNLSRDEVGVALAANGTANDARQSGSEQGFSTTLTAFVAGSDTDPSSSPGSSSSGSSSGGSGSDGSGSGEGGSGDVESDYDESDYDESDDDESDDDESDDDESDDDESDDDESDYDESDDDESDDDEESDDEDSDSETPQ